MNRLNMALFPCMLITVLATLLLRPVVVQAVTPGACGSWSVVPSPNVPSRINSLSAVAAVSANDVWAVGDDSGSKGNFFTLIEHWNGTQWSIVPSPNPGHFTNGNDLKTVSAVSATDVWAVGFGNTSDGALIVHWDGTQWRLVSHSPFPSASQLFGVTALSANNIWAVGSFFNSSGDENTLISHWDGTRWSIVASPNAGISDTLYAVTAVSARNIWAVGQALSSARGHENTLIEHWDGTHWSIVVSPNAGSTNFLGGVTAVSASDIWAVGISTGTLIEHWNGTRWSIVASPNPGSYNDLGGVAALSAQNIWAVGTTLKNGYQSLIEHWDGTQWSVFPSPRTFSLLGGVTVVPNSSDLWTVGNSSGQTLTEFYC